MGVVGLVHYPSALNVTFEALLHTLILSGNTLHYSFAYSICSTGTCLNELTQKVLLLSYEYILCHSCTPVDIISMGAGVYLMKH